MNTIIRFRLIIAKVLWISFFLLSSILKNTAQSYIGYGNTQLWNLEVNSCGNGCTVEPYLQPLYIGFDITFSPDGNLFVGLANDFTLWHVNPVTGFYYVYFDGPDDIETEGLVTLGNDIFYTIGDNLNNGDTLYEINVTTGIVTNLGSTGYKCISDITIYNGEIYYITDGGLIRLNIANPSSSEWVVTLPNYSYNTGLTASHLCNNLMGIRGIWPDTSIIDLINIIDGTITPICNTGYEPGYDVDAITSMLEFANPAPCVVMVDLDCDDSNTLVEYDCLDLEGVHITDSDIALFADDWVTEMTITIAPPVIDAPYEILDMTGSVPNIDESGSGSSSITLTNAGGATIQDFKDALQLIVYKNLNAPPTGGLRSIEVQFTTASGTLSNVEEYFIDVIELPLIPLDLGPDYLEECEGESVTLNAGNPGATFEWSTGDDTQTITIDQSGEYIVTVSDGINCPNQDTVVLDVVPVITVSLIGDTETCDNEPATLTIQTDSPFPITVTINADPGSPFMFAGIDGGFSFIDQPTVSTVYTITEVVPDQPACVEIPDPLQDLQVYPSYIEEVDISLCDGDSVWLGIFWETEAGVYENLLQSYYGCDSFVTATITVLPAVQITQQSTTCDPSSAGVFITHLDNPNGCDTVVTTTVSLLSSDTTLISLNTCVSTQAGIVTDTLSNQSGCDSLVITTTSYIPPADTTLITQMTCDSSLLGLSYDTLTNASGCDSIVALTVLFSLTDTTHVSGTSCIPSEISVFDSLYTNALGCDSLVIITITQGVPDTTAISATSCDPASLGVFEELLASSQGCDSLIITTVTFSAQDSTFINASTCDPTAAGVFVTTFINQFGCDSIVTETISLLPSDATSIQSTTCDPTVAGVFTQNLTNQFGCDSIVTQTISLLQSDQTSLSSTTCNAFEAGVFVTTLTNQYGCDSVVTETITLLPGDTTAFVFNTCDPTQVGAIETIYTGHDGCDSLVIENTTLFPLPVLQVQSAFDYNGFDISCAGDTDGSAIANVNGVQPYTYLWSTNETDQLITGLSAGAYAVSVTDGNGCTTNGVITLTEPELFMIGFEVSEPDCFDQQLGSITVKPSGGVAPYTYSIDGTVFQASSDFTGLSEGIYQITSLDANDCSATEIISIDVPLLVQVELGDNQIISIGDSAHLQAVINLPFDSLASIIWTGIDSIDCPNCLTQIVAPIITTAYSVSVISVDGCADRDSLTVSVMRDQKIYIPNIFSPNGDGINDVLSINISDGVEEITSFTIFDRWGNMVFLAEHVLPSGPITSWDGKMNGERMNPGVFTYKMVVVFESGEREVRYGDVTLIR